MRLHSQMLAGLILTLSFIVPGAASAAMPASPSAAINPLFAKIHRPLERAMIPVYLPTKATMHSGYAQLALVKPGHYLVYVGYVPNCNESTACNIGRIEGKRRPMHAARPAGKLIHVAFGLPGYFVASHCGASCGDATLTWDQGAFRYTIGLKAAREAEILKVVNGAIKAGPV